MSELLSNTNEENLWEEKNYTEAKKSCSNNNEPEQNDITSVIRNDLMPNPCLDTGKVSGIYKIINKTNNKYYVGSSIDITTPNEGRWYHHKNMLNKNIHSNIHLQRAWNKDGENSFIWIIIETTDVDNLLLIEQKYLDIAKSNPTECYNLTFIAGKIEMTDSTRRKIGDFHRNRLIDKTKHHMFGKHHSEETKQKIREKRKFQTFSEETINKFKIRTGEKNPNYGKGDKIRGKLNYHYNHTIYNFINIKTHETFSGTKQEFIIKFNLNKCVPHDLVRKWIKQSKSGWKINF